jgi:hypothetical protein
MATQWFTGYYGVSNLKSRYRDLAKKYHPDLGGDTETMKEINLQYEAALKARDGETYQGDDEREHVYHYNAKVERAIMDMIVELLKLHMEDVRILLIGTWIWVIGDTKPYKDSLKKLGLWWNGRRRAWSYHVGQYHGRHSNADLYTLARSYGSREFVAQEENAMVAA